MSNNPKRKMTRAARMAYYKENKLKGDDKIAYTKMAEDMAYVGNCTCGGPLILYLGSKPENRFNVYCMDCNSISDVRLPKKGDLYHTEGYENPLELVCDMYRKFKKLEITDEEIEKTPFSPLVNKERGSVATLSENDNAGTSNI